MPKIYDYETPCSMALCPNPGHYALNELYEDGTKIWLTDLCRHHEQEIHVRNQILREKYPGKIFIQKS